MDAPKSALFGRACRTGDTVEVAMTSAESPQELFSACVARQEEIKKARIDQLKLTLGMRGVSVYLSCSGWIPTC